MGLPRKLREEYPGAISDAMAVANGRPKENGKSNHLGVKP
jgi:hypothetical protein